MAVAVSLSPLPRFQFNQNGVPLAGGKVFTYLTNTTTKQATYTDYTGLTANTNPIILDANGQCECWLANNEIYTIVLAPSTDTDPPTNAFWTVSGIGGAGIDTGVITNIASLRALAGAVPSTVNVQGYYTQTDGGEGDFTYVSTDTTSADNGGTIIVDAVGRRWYRETNGMRYSVKWFGAKMDGVTNDIAAVQLCITAAEAVDAGVYFPAGTCFKSGSPWTITAGMIVEGNGYQADLGNMYQTPFARLTQTTGYSGSCIVCDEANSCFTVATNAAVMFRDLQITYPAAFPTAPTAGVTGIAISSAGGGTNINVGSQVIGVCITGADLGVTFNNCCNFILDRCVILNSFTGSMNCACPNLPSDGDNTVSNCTLFDFSENASYHILQTSGGGLNIVNNKLGATATTGTGILIDPNLNVAQNIEPLVITGNTIEGQQIGISFQRAVGNGTAGVITITGNELFCSSSALFIGTGAGSGSAQWIFGLAFTGNTAVVATNSANVIQIDGVNGAIISGNMVSTSGSGASILDQYGSNNAFVKQSGNVASSGSVEMSAVTTPSLGASGSPVTNTFPVTVAVYITGGAGTGIARNSTNLFTQSSGVFNNTVMLEPGDTITVVYSGGFNWHWEAVNP